MKGHQFKSWIFKLRDIERDQEFSLFLRFMDPIHFSGIFHSYFFPPREHIQAVVWEEHKRRKERYHLDIVSFWKFVLTLLLFCGILELGLEIRVITLKVWMILISGPFAFIHVISLKVSSWKFWLCFKFFWFWFMLLECYFIKSFILKNLVMV